jgi:hypothetical protein
LPPGKSPLSRQNGVAPDVASGPTLQDAIDRLVSILDNNRRPAARGTAPDDEQLVTLDADGKPKFDYLGPGAHAASDC